MPFPGSVTGGILNDVVNVHSDASDIRDLHEQLKFASKRHNGRKVAFSPKFARAHVGKAPGKRQQPATGKQRQIARIPGKQVTPKLKPPAGARPKRPASPLPKEPPRALLELQRQNKERAAGPAGLPPSYRQSSNQMFNELVGICKKIKTLDTAKEFKQTVDVLSSKGLNSHEAGRLRGMLVYQLKLMATDPKVSPQLTSSVLNTLVHREAREDILKIKDDFEVKNLEARLNKLRGRDSLASVEELEQRLGNLRRND